MPSPVRLRRLLNLTLRSLTLACRFLLVFLLARYLLPADLGRYGLLAAAVGYSLYVVGLDFYTYSTREAVGRPSGEWGALLKSQAALAGVLYLAFLPLLAAALIAGWLPPDLAAWFLLLLILEHLNQEAGRFLVVAGAQVGGSVAYFLRAGIWVPAVALLMWQEPALRTVETVLAAWSIGGAAALVLGAARLRALGLGGWTGAVDWAWLRRGLAVALPLLLGTLALRALFTLDRYWLALIAGMDVVGAYVVFAGVAQAVIMVLDASVFSFAYPALIQAHKAGDAAAFRRRLARLGLATLWISLGFAACAVLLIHPLLDWINQPFYAGHLELFYGAVLYSTLYALGLVPHYALYAQGHFRPLLVAHVAGLASFTAAAALLSGRAGAIAVPAALGIAFAVVLGWKLVAYRRLTPAACRPGVAAPPDE